MKYLCLLLIFSVFLPPKNGLASQITIRSQPEGAEVIIEAAQGGKRTKIGTTPIVIPLSQIDSITQGVAFRLEIIKPNFERYRLLVSATNKEEITLDAVLEPSLEMKMGANADILISGLFEAQRLTRAKDYEGALSKLKDLEKTSSTVSSVFELKGSVNYLKKDFTTSLAEFRKAYTLNPQNEVAQRMKDYLESKVNSGDKQ